MIGWLYTQALPKTVREAMKRVSNADCYRIKRRINTVQVSGDPNNSHTNVQELVDNVGGERVGGWLLSKDKRALKQGVYVWIFQSIWKTPEGEYVDVTKNESYGNDKESIFWLDPERQANLDEGKAYNLIAVLEHFKAAAYLSETSYKQLTPGKPYWAEKKLRFFKELDEHSGVYRMIDSNNPQNIKLLEEQYDCKVISGHVVPNNQSNRISTQMFFDFSIG